MQTPLETSLEDMQRTFDLVQAAASNGRGISLVPSQTENLTRLVIGLDQQCRAFIEQLSIADHVIAQYVEQFGDDLLLEIASTPTEVEASDEESTIGEETSEGEAQGVASSEEVVEGVVLTEAPGLDSEVAGLDAPSETQES